MPFVPVPRPYQTGLKFTGLANRDDYRMGLRTEVRRHIRGTDNSRRRILEDRSVAGTMVVDTNDRGYTSWYPDCFEPRLGMQRESIR
jgi:hypothetical protein